MKIERECHICGVEYCISFVPAEFLMPDTEADDESEDTLADDVSAEYPEYCPFCGSREGEDEFSAAAEDE